MKTFTIGKNDATKRLDKFIQKAAPMLPKNLMYKYIRLKRIKVNGKKSDIAFKLKEGDVVDMYINDEFFEAQEDKYDFLKAPGKLDIIYEDEKQNSPKPVSIGIISPFRGQVELIKKAILTVFSQETIQKHEIEVGTAHTFQGDERDIILMSWTIAPNSHSQSMMFLQKPNLFNVAITRARKRLINFISKPVNELPEGLLRDYLEYVNQQEKIISSRKNVFKNKTKLRQTKTL